MGCPLIPPKATVACKSAIKSLKVKAYLAAWVRSVALAGKIGVD